MAFTKQQSRALLKQSETLIAQRNFAAANQILLPALQDGLTIQRVYELLGIILLETGEFADASARLQQAVMADVKVASSHYHLGIALEKLGKPAEAIQSYTRAATLDSENLPPLRRAANLLATSNQPEQALSYSVRMCHIAPLDQAVWNFYTRLTHKFTQFFEIELTLKEPIEKALASNMHNGLRTAILRQLQFSDWVMELSSITNITDYEDYVEQTRKIVTKAEFITKLQNSSLPRLMHRSTLPYNVLELILTHIRKHLLLHSKKIELETYKPLLIALWALGFNNEYVFFISDEEQKALVSLRDSLNKSETLDLIELALLGSYSPLILEGFAEKLSNWETDDKIVQTLITEQIIHPLDERKRMESIPILTEIEDSTTQKVREQYEDAPYPRWHEMPEYKSLPLVDYVNNYGTVNCANDSLPDNPKDVLIAGGGTGQHPIMLARCLRKYKLLAIDISRASLAYAQRKADDFKIKNLEFMQADILTLNKLDRQFDLIESIGVLHHMQDPVAGWREITKLLKPGGVMRIGLYSTIAREAITLARSEIETRNLGDSDDAIRHYRQNLFARNYNHKILNKEDDTELTPIIPKLIAATDFYALSECRDLLFHVQEHQFTLLQIKEIIAELGLNFLGMNLMHNPILDTFQKTLPESDRGTDLERWHEYELEHPETFNGMHQFWLQKPKN